jgi:membrane protein DedA with SNARE-associated domain
VSDTQEPHDATLADEPEIVVEDAVPGEPEDADSGPKEWWDDPRLPWRHKPTRADIACYTGIAILGVWALVMLPLRPLLLANPPLSAVINGGRTSVVATGAFLEVNGGSIVIYWLAVTLSIVKFDWVYWWAGKLWGAVILETFTGNSKMSKRRAEIVLKFTHRYETLAVVATYLPLPLPMALIYAAVGASGMRLRKFLIIDIITAAVTQAGWLWLGWQIGEPAVRIVRIYADYSLYVTIGILVVMFATWWWRRSRTAGRTA